jgi:nitrous oxide reductase
MKIDTNTLSSNILKYKHDLQKNIENIWNQLIQGIDNIINRNLPSKQSSATFTNPWANTTIKKLSRRKKKAYNKARRSNSEQDCAKYKRLKLLSQKTTRQAHSKYLYDIISPKLKDNSKQFYSNIKSKKQDSSGISPLRDNQGYLHSEAKDKAEILNAQFKYVYTQEDHTNIPHNGPSPYSAMQNITITKNGVYKLLRNIKPHKAT